MCGALLVVCAGSGCAVFSRADRVVSPDTPALTQPRFPYTHELNPYPRSETEGPALLKGLTLQAAIELALTNNRALKRAQSELERARLECRVAAATVFEPTLLASYAAFDDTGTARLSAPYDSWLGIGVEPFLELDYDADGSPSHTSELGLSLSRRLFHSAEHLRLRLPTLRAQKAMLVASNGLARVTRETRYEVLGAFFALQRAVVRHEVRTNRLKDATEFVEATRDRVAHGFAAPIDEVNARINLNQARLDLLREETSVKNAQADLLAGLALDINGQVELQFEDVASAADFAPELEADLAAVMAGHEALVNQRLDVDLAAKELRVQRDLLRPQVSVGVTSRAKWEGDAFFGTASDDEPFSLDLSYETALDGSKRERAKLAQLERRQVERLSALRDAEDAMETRLRSLHRKALELRSSIELAAERFQTEERKLAATMRRYEAGNVDNLEVTRAKQDLVDAEIRLLDARIDLWLRRAEYESLIPGGGRRDEAETTD